MGDPCRHRSGTKFMSDIHVLDVTTGVWREIQAEGFGAQQPSARSGHAAAVVCGRLQLPAAMLSRFRFLSESPVLPCCLPRLPVFQFPVSRICL